MDAYMNNSALLSFLRIKFSSEDAARILSALRQDSLIWQSLQNQELLDEFITSEVKDVYDFAPARLALMAVGQTANYDALRERAQFLVDDQLQKKALQFLKTACQSQRQLVDVREAGLMALALRERWRLSLNWRDVFEPLGYSVPRPKQPQLWRAALVCLFGLVPDGMNMLKALAEMDQSGSLQRVIAHVLLSQPFSRKEHQRYFTLLLSNVPVAHACASLHSLVVAGHKDLAKELAEALLERQKEAGLAAEGEWESLQGSELLAHMGELQTLAALYHIAGQTNKAGFMLAAAEQAARSWHTGIAIQRISAASGSGESNEVETKTLSGGNAGLIFTQPEASFLPERMVKGLAGVDPLEVHPFLLIRKAGVLLQNGDAISAKTLAKEAVQQIIAKVGSAAEIFSPKFVPDWNPVVLLDILNSVGLESEALQLALLFQHSRPGDLVLLAYIEAQLERREDWPNAMVYAQIAAIVAPEDARNFRKLAELQEKQKHFKDAYESWAQVIRLSENPAIEAWLRFGENALRAEMPRIAAKACESALEKEPQNSRANALMGKALQQLEKYEDAIPHLTLATQTAPQDSENWIELSQAYLQMGLKDHALLTLQAGYAALPRSASVNYALGKAYQISGKPDEALPFFEAAAGLDPDSRELAYELGANLFELKKHAQAAAFLSKSLEKWPQDYALAALVAENALAEGDYTAAIPALEIAITHPGAANEIKLKYVQALFGGHNPLMIPAEALNPGNLHKAEAALHTVLEKLPHSFAAQLALAEVMGAAGKSAEALERFKVLMETPQITLPEWRGRLYAGLGAVADALEMKEIALAAMKEAAQASPESVSVAKKLAEAYLHADLVEEAFQAAQVVRSMAPDQIEELIWFADLSNQTGHLAEATESLQCATEIHAEQPALWARLAEYQNKCQDSACVRESLEKMLALGSVAAPELRVAAYLYLGMDDLPAALACLLRAGKGDAQPNPELMFELACVQARCGNMTAAEEALRPVLAAYPENVCLQMLHADLLTALERPQGALASLQRLEGALGQIQHFPFPRALTTRVLPEDWYQSLTAAEALDLRMGVLLKRVNDPEAALVHLEKALQRKPDSAIIRYWVVELADAMLFTAKVLDLLKPVEEKHWEAGKSLENLPDEEKRAWEALLGVCAEYALEQDQHASVVEKILQTSALFGSDNPRHLAAKSRQLARQNDKEAAKDCYRQAKHALHTRGTEKTRESQSPLTGFDIAPDVLAGVELGICEAAFEIQEWQPALQMMEQYVAAHPYERRALLRNVRMIVRLREVRDLAMELKAVRHAPDQKVLAAASEEKFDELMRRLENLSNAEEVERWGVRGSMIFRSSFERIRAFAKNATRGDDLAALLAALRRTRNYAGAVQMGQKHALEPKLLLEYGLSLQKIVPQKGVESLQQAILHQPNDPLLLAGLASVEQEAGAYPEAFLAIEGALELWPDEPEWHAWAAQLAELLQQRADAVQHWEQAAHLVPEKLDYSLALGKAYLNNQEVTAAIAWLENISQGAGEQGQVWLLLSQAYQQGQAWQEALQASDRAAAVDRYSAEPVLQSGRISLAMGNQKKAMECADLALKRAPGDPDCILFLCDVYKAAGKNLEALRIVEEALNGGQVSSALRLEHAKLIYGLKGANESVPLLLALSETFPDDAKILGMLAKVQLELGHTQEAGINAYHALKLDGNLQGLSFLIGRLKREEGQLDQAVHFFSEAVRQYPQDLEAYIALGETHLARRENGLALQTFQKAMKIAPQDYRLYYKAGVILRDQKDYMNAEAMMRRASELAPGDVNIRRQLGAIVTLNLVHNPREVKSCL